MSQNFNERLRFLREKLANVRSIVIAKRDHQLAYLSDQLMDMVNKLIEEEARGTVTGPPVRQSPAPSPIPPIPAPLPDEPKVAITNCHDTLRKLTMAQAREIREHARLGTMTRLAMARKYGVSHGTIDNIVHKRSYKEEPANA